MSEIYNKPFKIGAAATVVVFVFVNLVVFLDANFYRNNSRFASFDPPVSGFPFAWNREILMFTGDGTILNVLFIAVCALTIGFLVKFIWTEYEERK